MKDEKAEGRSEKKITVFFPLCLCYFVTKEKNRK